MPNNTTNNIITKAHCNKCQGERNHELLHEVKTSWEEEVDHEYGGMDGWDKYQMLQCRGCDSVTYRHQHYFSEDRDRDDDGIRDTYFPPAIARKEPEWLSQVNSDNIYNRFVSEALKDIYIAIHNGSLWLASMGTRSLLEHVMIEKIGDLGTFQNHVTAFHSAGYITPIQKEFLNTVIEGGHASIHGGWRPSVSHFNTLMDVTESVIQNVYVLHKKIEEVKEKIPQRSNKKDK